jgi:hypothetical protein
MASPFVKIKDTPNAINQNLFIVCPPPKIPGSARLWRAGWD